MLGGPPECPERPFCQPGLEDTYGIEVAEFRSLDAGGPLTKNAITTGEIALGLVFSSDGALATAETGPQSPEPRPPLRGGRGSVMRGPRGPTHPAAPSPGSGGRPRAGDSAGGAGKRARDAIGAVEVSPTSAASRSMTNCAAAPSASSTPAAAAAAASVPRNQERWESMSTRTSDAGSGYSAAALIKGQPRVWRSAMSAAMAWMASPSLFVRRRGRRGSGQATDGGVLAAQVGEHQALLAREVAVEGRARHSRLAHDAVDADRVDAFLIKQGRCGRQQAIAGPIGCGGGSR
ncbi:hypothetical protein GCM10025876_29520 [Demequina litorisediminis]|uniref:Uncharacterized protein n=1 Tax=Demequina litorisediminis TaxID=1849022 RepID=A0ABQ6IHX3_9MICO|nr:hypothetical protein GCM10025876_29520 [Demequina litorisediminis]